jgi:serine/threonine-protein kinase
MHAEAMQDELAVERFLDEVRLAAAMTHASIGVVVDANRIEGRPYAAYSYVAGRSFAEVMAAARRHPVLSKRLPAVVCHVVARACLGLAVIHQGIASSGLEGMPLPSGLSPQSWLVGYDGSVLISGFGARTWGEQGLPPGPGLLEADYPYRAPERIQEQPADRRADFWAIGAMLVEGLVGVQPFLRGTRAAIDQAITADALPNLQTSVPPALARIVQGCLRRAPSERPADGSQIAEALTAFVDELKLGMTEAELGQCMQQLFADEKEAESAALRTLSIAEASAYLYSDHGRGLDVAIGAGAAVALPAGQPSTADLWAHTSMRTGTSRPLPPAPVPPAARVVDEEDEPSIALPKSRGPMAVVLGAAVLVVAIIALGSRESPTAVGTAPPAARPAAVAPPAKTLPRAPVAAQAPLPPPERAPMPLREAPAATSAQAASAVPAPALLRPEAPAAEVPSERSSRRAHRRRQRETAAADNPYVAEDPAPAKPARAAKNAARGEPGTVVIGASDGWADVYFEGKRLGATPLRTELPSGQLSLEIRPFGSGTPRALRVQVKPGEVAKVRVPL